MALIRALRVRVFALLWAGQLVSALGDGLYLVAVAWWVLDETGSAAALGTVLICSTVPLLIFLLIGGVAVDRLPRLQLMLISDLVRAAVSGTLALLVWQDRLLLWQLFVASALFGSVRAFFMPAYSAVVPDVLPTEMLPSANSLRSLGRQLASVAGPAAGGVIVAGGGTAAAFALDSCSFLVSAICIAGVARHGALGGRGRGAGSGPEHAGVLVELREGLGTVLRSSWLWLGIAVAGVSVVTLDGPQGAVLPLLVREDLDAGVRIFALLSSLSAVGAIFAAIWLGRAARLRRRGRLMYGAWVTMALAATAMGLPVTIVGVAAASVLFGAASATVALVWMNTLQELVPRDRLGRVFSIDAFGSYALLPVGYAASGLAADRLGASLVFVLGGLVSAAVIALGLLHPAVRALD